MEKVAITLEGRERDLLTYLKQSAIGFSDSDIVKAALRNLNQCMVGDKTADHAYVKHMLEDL